MTDPIQQLRAQALQSLTALHAGVRSVRLADFPDHGNIGDSAIALGEQRFWADAGIDLLEVQSQVTATRSIFTSSEPVAVHGGGNLGGLYPSSDSMRAKLASRLPSETLLLQEPQTVHFTSPAEERKFHLAFGARANTRVAVRDHRSAAIMGNLVPEVILSPDAVHVLGPIEAPQPTAEVVVLRRRDGESSGDLRSGSDWPADPKDLNAARWWSNRVAGVAPLRTLFHRQPATWMSKADRRFRRGVDFLAQGETIVTDRLHAMLIGLQMGRKVVATDNSYGKLSAYAETWLQPFADRLDLRVPVRG
jgi:exopolysaccharide biosynthesis predicted pyruvyltransferase EpsI